MDRLRLIIQHEHNNIIHKTATEISDDELRRRAIILAPHQDDETLGCGGTIIKKRRMGADIKIVFASDGSASHHHLIEAEKLKAIRHKEALAAAQHLGLADDDVAFLDFKDGQLTASQNAITKELQDIFQTHQPDQVFIPYHKEPPPDHVAVNNTVVSALQTCHQSVTVYEYPVWFWNHWPWTNPLSLIRADSRRKLLLNTFYAGVGLTDFNCFVGIADVIDLKREALNQYRSQMSQLIPNVNWITLNDVSNGEWLACFFQGFELFRRYKSTGGHQ
jgi:LmbE family N-acetylglucosaminyl deacetylase